MKLRCVAGQRFLIASPYARTDSAVVFYVDDMLTDCSKSIVRREQGRTHFHCISEQVDSALAMNESRESSEAEKGVSSSALSTGGRKRVRDSAQSNMLPFAVADAATSLDTADDDAMRDEEELYDMVMDFAVQEGRELHADGVEDSDVASVAAAAANRSSASLATAPPGTPYYPNLGAADLDEEYVVTPSFRFDHSPHQF